MKSMGVYVCVQVFQSAQELLQGYQVHPEIQAQMFAYLFFFSNVSLFNQLMDKGIEKAYTHTHSLSFAFALDPPVSYSCESIWETQWTKLCPCVLVSILTGD